MERKPDWLSDFPVLIYCNREVIRMDQVKTGRLIRTMRTKLGLTQLALAEQLGVSDKAVSKWERGVSHS